MSTVVDLIPVKVTLLAIDAGSKCARCTAKADRVVLRGNFARYSCAEHESFNTAIAPGYWEATKCTTPA